MISRRGPEWIPGESAAAGWLPVESYLIYAHCLSPERAKATGVSQVDIDEFSSFPRGEIDRPNHRSLGPKNHLDDLHQSGLSSFPNCFSIRQDGSLTVLPNPLMVRVGPLPGIRSGDAITTAFIQPDRIVIILGDIQCDHTEGTPDQVGFCQIPS